MTTQSPTSTNHSLGSFLVRAGHYRQHPHPIVRKHIGLRFVTRRQRMTMTKATQRLVANSL
jgi:hypothetical protein